MSASDVTPEMEAVVDSVLAICKAMDTWNPSVEELVDVFGAALEGGIEYTCVKMTMISMALGIVGKRKAGAA